MEITDSRMRPLLAARRDKTTDLSRCVVQVLLAAAFCVAGVTKVTQPMAVLSQQFGWPRELSEPIVRAIGMLELLGAGAILLPAVTGVHPRLTALAALALMNLMVVACLFRLIRNEFFHLPAPLILGGLAAYVACRRTESVIAEKKEVLP